MIGPTIPNSVFLNAGAFVPPSTGPMPGYDLTGLAYDKDTDETAAILLVAPLEWPSVTIYLIGTTTASSGVLPGNAVIRLEYDFATNPDPVVVTVSEQFEYRRVLLDTDVTLSAMDDTPYQGKVSSLRRDANSESPADTLNGDLIVWGLELLRGQPS